MSETDLLLSMRGIEKAFPGVHALEGVDFDLAPGEIHALVGENGAGKSTLIKVLTGVERPDAGTITFDGQDVHVRSPEHAQSFGISTVYQEINLCPNLSMAENILIGRAPRRWGRIDWRAMNRRAAADPRDLDIEVDVTQPLGSYSVAIQQMAAIARALDISSARILILDEPTSSLDAHETEQLFGVMRKLRRLGHRDRLHHPLPRPGLPRSPTASRSCATAGSSAPTPRSALPRFDLIAKMLGRNLTELDDMTQIKLATSQEGTGEARLAASQVGRAGSIEPFDLELRAGEVVGLAGLLGSGRTEMAGLLFGIDQPDSGSITVDGKIVDHHSPLGSIARGVALCPEDRKAEGIVDDLTVRENIVLAVQAGRGWLRSLSLSEQYAIADKYIGLLRIATPSADQPVRTLSGGNQQKVILARWLADEPAGPHPRRADARHRRRRQGRGPTPRPRAGRGGQGLPVHLVGARRGHAHEPSHRRSARPDEGRRVLGRGRRVV